MRKLTILVLFAAAATGAAFADQKQIGDTILKDSQPTGLANKHIKHQKHQVYDLTFDAAGNEYVCRTNPDKSVNATDFVVGTPMHYEIGGKKAKIVTPGDKKLECSIVRVALIPAAPQ